MKIRDVLAVATLCLSAASAQAATVLIPTDGNVNVYVDFGSLANLDAGFSLAIFDDSVTTVAQMGVANHLDIASNQRVGFLGPSTGGDFIATAEDTGATLTLSSTNNFILGLTDGTDWFMDIGTGPMSLGASTEQIVFDQTNKVVLADVTVSPIPLPAAVWLFGAGMIGLAGIARRRS